MSESVDAYVGPDRRQRLPRTVHEPNRRLLIAIAVAVLVYGIVVPTVVAEVLGSDRTIQASTVATIVCTILFAQGGLLLLLRWRLTGDGRSFHLGVAALVYGFFVAPVAEVYGILASDEPHRAILQSVAQSAVGMVAAIVAVKGGLTSPVDSRLSPARSMALAGGVLVVLSTGAYAGFHALPGRFDGLYTVLAAAAAGGAWVVAGALMWRGPSGRTAMSNLLSAPLLVLGIGSIASAWSVATPVPFSLDAAALTMSAGVLLAGGAGYALLSTLSGQGAANFRLRALLRNLESYRAMEEERVHDARSALLAVQAATTALTRYREHLDDQARSNLELAVESELARLVGLMEHSSSPTVRAVARQTFDVVEPVRAVTTAAAAFGVQVELDLPKRECWAVGNRDDTARVLETLVDNARRYAAGSPLRVRVRSDGTTVRIVVTDRGPGIPATERELVFTRGGRGRSSQGTDGSGLGLFAARRLMEDQEGRLVLARSGPPGATFVIALPAAAAEDGSAPAGAGRPAARSLVTPAARPLFSSVGGTRAAARSGVVRHGDGPEAA